MKTDLEQTMSDARLEPDGSAELRALTFSVFAAALSARTLVSGRADPFGARCARRGDAIQAGILEPPNSI